MSLLSSATYSPRARPIPAFTAPAKPWFSASASTSASGCEARTCSAVPSVEPLSTTSTSKSRKRCSRREASAASSSSRPFQVGTITVTRVIAAAARA